LADKVVELGYVDSISHEAVRRVKKNELKAWSHKQWCIKSKASAAFVYAMEDILSVYKQAFDQEEPLIYRDETSKQFTAQTSNPIPGTPRQPERYDYEYKRNGVCNLFLFFEPLGDKRQVTVTDRRTKSDWVVQIKQLLDVHYPKAKKVTLVMDNLNTHKGASLYEVFEPGEARRLLDRLNIHYTPKHGSCLNMAEIELSVLSRQCLNRRIPYKESLAAEMAAWQKRRNTVESKTDWHFTNDDARIKLKRL
jgi:transposase